MLHCFVLYGVYTGVGYNALIPMTPFFFLSLKVVPYLHCIGVDDKGDDGGVGGGQIGKCNINEGECK